MQQRRLARCSRLSPAVTAKRGCRCSRQSKGGTGRDLSGRGLRSHYRVQTSRDSMVVATGRRSCRRCHVTAFARLNDRRAGDDQRYDVLRRRVKDWRSLPGPLLGPEVAAVEAGDFLEFLPVDHLDGMVALGQYIDAPQRLDCAIDVHDGKTCRVGDVDL